MEQKHDLPDTLPPDWKWQSLFDTPAALHEQWQLWLAGAQRAEEQSLLRYWARRSNSTSAAA
jgi:hypothetical protein